MNSMHKNTVLLLKLGIAFAFLYPAFSAFYSPALWIGYIPAWIDSFIPRETFLPIFSAFEIIVALGVLFWNRALPAIVAGAMLVSIVALNRNEFSVVFRDLSIACMAFALASLMKK